MPLNKEMDKSVYTFINDNCPKVNVTALLEIELT